MSQHKRRACRLVAVQPDRQQSSVGQLIRLARDAQHGSVMLPAEHLHPGDTIELEGVVFVIAGRNFGRASVAFVFVGIEDFIYCAARSRLIRLLAMREERVVGDRAVAAVLALDTAIAAEQAFESPR